MTLMGFMVLGCGIFMLATDDELMGGALVASSMLFFFQPL